MSIELKRFKIPTYQEAKEITDNSDGVFYEKKEIVNGKEFAIFNYRLANHNDFKDDRYFELRGITYDLETGRVFPSLHKFFNQNENELVMDELSGELETRIKLDGSLIQPVVIGDKVLYKTKGTFKSEQVRLLCEKIDLENVNKFILDMYYYHNIIPLFELISPHNQIVVNYDSSNLVLIQARDIETGNYLEYDRLRQLSQAYNVPVVDIVSFKYSDLLKLKREVKGEEGWITWNKEQNPFSFRKIKTDWYLTLHRLISPDELIEHKLIQHILDETIDDILQNLPEKSEKRKYIEEIVDLVSGYFNRSMRELQEIFTLDKPLFNESRKKFVDKYRNHHLFPVLMRTMEQDAFNEEYVEEMLKQCIQKNANKQMKAREFLKQLKEIAR